MGVLQRLVGIEKRRAGQKGPSATLQAFQGTKSSAKNDGDDYADGGGGGADDDGMVITCLFGSREERVEATARVGCEVHGAPYSLVG